MEIFLLLAKKKRKNNLLYLYLGTFPYFESQDYPRITSCIKDS